MSKENPKFKQKYKRNMSVEEKTKIFIEEAREVHGDKYNYSKFQMKGYKDKSTIICPIHGEFEMTRSVHIKLGCGCPECGKEIARKMQEEKRDDCKKNIFNRANKIHNNKYNYSKFNYININEKSTIICPIHGEFEMNMNKHIYRGHGCPHCSKESNISKNEEIVMNILDDNNIEYQYSYIIPNNNYLRNKPYDFYLPEYNLLIEVNGEQHYKKKFNMTDEDLKIRKEIDKNKKEISLNEGYNFLELNASKNKEEFKTNILEEVQRLKNKSNVD